MSNLKDVIDVDGTKRSFDIDTAELGEMADDQATAVVTFRSAEGEPIKIVVGRSSYRLLAGWIALSQAKADRRRTPDQNAAAA